MVGSEGVIVSSRQMSNFSAISWQEQVTFNEMMYVLSKMSVTRHVVHDSMV